jgi:hypothetical protein
MISKVIRAAALLVMTLAVPAVVVVAPLPASAATSGSMCEVYGHQYCLNTPNFNLYTPVTESGSGARTINAVLQNGNTYKLEFNGDPSKCVASDNSGQYAEVKLCSATNGVNWTRQHFSDGDRWANPYAGNQCLSGSDTPGGFYIFDGCGASGGAYQKFTFK